MTVSTAQARVSYLGDGTSVNFAIPFPFFLTTDLLVLLAGSPITSGYSTTGGNGSTGTLAMATAPGAGVNLQIILNDPLTQLVNLVDGTAFPSATLNQINDRIVQIALRLSDRLNRSITAPDGDTAPVMTLPNALARANKALMFDSFGNLATGTPNTQTITTALLAPFLALQQTAAELAAGIVPANFAYPPGTPERYGAVGDGIHDDTVALTHCIACNDTVQFTEGKIYGVISVAFPQGGPHYVNFNGAWIRGIAAAATNSIVSIQCEGTTFIAYAVDGNFNPNYLCGTWWYNASANSQYNTVLGMRHRYLGGAQTGTGTTIRAMIYGALVGNTSTGLAQSENSVYGWRTRGCQNPCYVNHTNGRLFFAEPIFVVLNEEWVSGFNYANARCLENVSGSIVTIHGGEIQYSGPEAGSVYAAELQNVFITDCNIETPIPMHVIGDWVRIRGGYVENNAADQPSFVVSAGATGSMTLDGAICFRFAGVGASSSTPLIDSSANATYEIYLTNSQSFEWRWSLIGGDVRLVKGGDPLYKNHRMQITGSDPNVYVLNTDPTDSLLEGVGFDRLGYTTTGWVLTVDFGASSTMTSTTAAGPSGFLASQLTLHATGTAIATFGNPSSQANLQATAVHVVPGELYWVAAQCNISAGGNGKLSARFFTLAGALVSDVPIADSGAIPTASWKFVEGPLAVPANAAYMCIGAYANVSDLQITDLRLRRAS